MANIQIIQAATIVIFVLFAAAMVTVGVVTFRKTHSMEGYLLGGRNVSGWVTAFAYGTSYFSAVVFVGYAGKHGWDIGIGSLWIGVGNAVIGCLLSWLLLARRTRKMTHTLNSKTMPEYFEARYDSTPLKLFSALIIFVFLVPYSSAVYKGLGYMFNAVFPSVSVNICMLAIACLTAVYLVLGGYLATAYTDFIQGLIMVFGLVCMIIAIFNTEEVGGFSNFMDNLAAIPDNGDGIDGSQLTNPWGGSSFSFLCVNILLTSFGVWALPQMVNKYYAVREGKAIRQGTIVSTVFALIIGIGAYLGGSCSRLILGNKLPAEGHDQVIPDMLTKALSANMFTIVILAIIVILLFSASMSTLSSVVLASASAIAVDLAPELKKNFRDTWGQMTLMRTLCLVFIALSFIFATMNISIIVNMMSFSWGIVAGCFMGPYIWGIYARWITKAGAWCGMVGGFLTVAIPTAVITAGGTFADAVALAPELGCLAMAASFVITPVFSLFTKKLDKEFLEKVFS